MLAGSIGSPGSQYVIGLIAVNCGSAHGGKAGVYSAAPRSEADNGLANLHNRITRTYGSSILWANILLRTCNMTLLPLLMSRAPPGRTPVSCARYGS